MDRIALKYLKSLISDSYYEIFKPKALSCVNFYVFSNKYDIKFEDMFMKFKHYICVIVFQISVIFYLKMHM